MKRTFRAAIPSAVLALALAALAGCGNSGAATEPDGTRAVPSAGELPSKVPAGTKLVVADQSENTQSALRASGELDKLPFTVEFANFTGGPAILEAFRAGAADVAGVGDTPPIQAQASGEDVPIVAAVQRSSRNTRLAVAPGANVRTLADLKDKRIAYAEGTAQQAIVLRALDKAGLTTTDVELTRLQLGDFLDAVRTGQVDVAPLGEPNLTRFIEATKAKGGEVISESETHDLSTGLSYVYARRQVLEDPAKAAAVRVYVEHWIRAQQWVSDHPKEWVDSYYVRNQHISKADGDRIVAANGIPGFPKLADLVKTQQRTIDLIKAAGELPKPLDAAKEFDLRFDPVIEKVVTDIGARTEPKDVR
ncbi:ABC transporter substrate-binding protein [Actinopolymorpha alba]|uniref:ABC transporter substrate-binding protein n=1 Tax=Actinopolymorpha alba TaxID=533267 RepID=UPI000367D39A|nr:ABC transporter substrate-binding protein [Actinopolymorpha alba]